MRRLNRGAGGSILLRHEVICAFEEEKNGDTRWDFAGV